MVTGWPSIAASIFSKSLRCIAASLLRWRRLSASDDAMIMSWNSPMRPSSLNMRSVLHSPMPRAPYSRACRAAAGVSALARTPSRLAACAHPSTVLNSGMILGLTVGRAPLYTDPSLPSIVIVSPSRMTAPPGTEHCAFAQSMRMPDVPTMHGLPMPRATTAACEDLPPLLVSMPTDL